MHALVTTLTAGMEGITSRATNMDAIPLSVIIPFFISSNESPGSIPLQIDTPRPCATTLNHADLLLATFLRRTWGLALVQAKQVAPPPSVLVIGEETRTLSPQASILVQASAHRNTGDAFPTRAILALMPLPTMGHLMMTAVINPRCISMAPPRTISLANATNQDALLVGARDIMTVRDFYS